MPKFKKFTGNYIEAAKWMRLPPAVDLCELQSLDEYNSQIEKDLHRTAYLSFDHTTSEMKEQLRDPSHLTDENRSFSQGNFDGGVFTRLIRDLHPKYQEVMRLANLENTLDQGMAGDIRVAYIDDEGNPCALSIAYLRDDPDPDKGDVFIPVGERKRAFTVCIIKNTNLAPADREVTLLTHPLLIKDGQENTPDIDEQDIPEEVSRLLNSKVVSVLLTGVFEGESISLSKFNALDNRIKEDRNIDNRDFKQKQLTELNEVVQNLLPEDIKVRAYMTEINDRASSDINFFEDKNYNKTLTEVFDTVNSAIAEIEAQEQREALLLKTKLTDFALRLDLKIFEVQSANTAGLILVEQYKQQAQLFRDLRDKPTGEEKNYSTMSFEQLVTILEKRVSRTVKLQQLMNSEARKCHSDQEALAHLKIIEDGVMNDIDSYTDESFSVQLDSISPQFALYLKELEEKDTPLLKEKMQDFVRQLKERAAVVSDEDLSEQILIKAENLSHLSYIELIPYKKLDFPQVLTNVVKEINNEREKDEIVRQMKEFVETLTEQDPPF
jgi:hypothetical protein